MQKQRQQPCPRDRKPVWLVVLREWGDGTRGACEGHIRREFILDAMKSQYRVLSRNEWNNLMLIFGLNHILY